MPPPPRISPQQSSKQPARSPAGPSSQGQATLASLQNLALSGAQIDLLARRVTIDRVALRRPAASLARDARGMLNAAAWLVTPTPAPTPAPTPVPAAAAVTTAAKAPPARPGHGPAAAQSDPAWQLQLRELAWQGGQLQWADALPATPVHLRLGQFRGRLQDLAWPPVPAHAPGATAASDKTAAAATPPGAQARVQLAAWLAACRQALSRHDTGPFARWRRNRTG